MISSSTNAVNQIHEALANGSKVFCQFKMGDKYQVHEINGTKSNAWVVLATVGPVNFYSRRIEGWEIVKLEDIHNKSTTELKKPLDIRDNRILDILKELSSCASEWSKDDAYQLLKIPSFLWQEILEITKHE